jgi:hypothetical protein
MASMPSFRSWEPTWNRYGSLVQEVALVLNPLANDLERTEEVTASAATGLLDRDSIDPLAALLAGLLDGRSRADRIIAAQCLVQRGIDIDRAAKATETGAGATTSPPAKASKKRIGQALGRALDQTKKPLTQAEISEGIVSTSNPSVETQTVLALLGSSSTQSPLSPGPTDSVESVAIEVATFAQASTFGIQQTRPATTTNFDMIRAAAIERWAQQPSTNRFETAELESDLVAGPESRPVRNARLASLRKEQTLTDLAQRNPEQQVIELTSARKRRKRNTIFGILAVLLISTAAGQFLGRPLLNRFRDRKAPTLLVVKDLPKQWELTFATAHQPAEVLNPTTVFQRFDSLDKRQTVLVTTVREDRRFVDSSLGTPRVDPANLAAANMKFQGEATASDSFPVHSPPNAPVMMEWKQPLIPFMINQTETVVYLEAYGIPSSDVRDLGRRLTPRPNLLQNGWFTPEGFTEQIVTPRRAVLEGIQSSLTFTSALDGKTRVIVQMRRAGEPTIEIGDLRDERETVELPNGRAVKFNRGFRHNYWWTESGYEFSATLLRSEHEDRRGFGSVHQATDTFSLVEPLPDRHLDGVLDLLDRIRLEKSEQWRSLTARYQASLRELVLLDTAKIHGHSIETRGVRVSVPGKGTVSIVPMALCTNSLCSPIYGSSDGLAREADLLIDDHWWHFRQIAKFDKTIPKYFTSPAVDRFETGEANFDSTYKWWGIDFGPKTTAARNANEPNLLLRPLPR